MTRLKNEPREENYVESRLSLIWNNQIQENLL